MATKPEAEEFDVDMRQKPLLGMIHNDAQVITGRGVSV